MWRAHRPKPPSVLKEILLRLAQVSRAKLVVDLGSGTGLSTRYWADAADLVIGMEADRRHADQGDGCDPRNPMSSIVRVFRLGRVWLLKELTS